MENQKQITENNKLLAEFLGSNEKNIENFGGAKNLKYHSDWNWLMSVVEKISKIPSYDKGDRFSTIVKIENKKCTIYSDNYNIKDKIYSKNIYYNTTFEKNTALESVYNACVEFVKWYNEQK